MIDHFLLLTCTTILQTFTAGIPLCWTCLQSVNFSSLHTSLCVGQVPALEHNNQVKRESLDLLKYIDGNFDGPAMLPDVRQIHSILIVGAMFVNGEHYLSVVLKFVFLKRQDSAKKQFAEELLAYSDEFNSTAFFSCLRAKGHVSDEAGKTIRTILPVKCLFKIFYIERRRLCSYLFIMRYICFIISCRSG